MFICSWINVTMYTCEGHSTVHGRHAGNRMVTMEEQMNTSLISDKTKPKITLILEAGEMLTS